MNIADALLKCEILCDVIFQGLCICVCVREQLLCQLVDRQTAMRRSRMACGALRGKAGTLPPPGCDEGQTPQGAS